MVGFSGELISCWRRAGEFSVLVFYIKKLFIPVEEGVVLVEVEVEWL